MTIKDLLDMDIRKLNKLTRAELSKIVTQLGSAANKRYKRLNSKNMKTPAIKALKKSGGKISVRGKNINQLRSEYIRATNFLRAKTSTISGAKKVVKMFEKRIGGKLTVDQVKTFWNVYNRIAEYDPYFLRLYGSTNMQRFIRDEIIQEDAKEIDDLVKIALNRINAEYESNGENYDGAEFFRLEDV